MEELFDKVDVGGREGLLDAFQDTHDFDAADVEEGSLIFELAFLYPFILCDFMLLLLFLLF